MFLFCLLSKSLELGPHLIRFIFPLFGDYFGDFSLYSTRCTGRKCRQVMDFVLSIEDPSVWWSCRAFWPTVCMRKSRHDVVRRMRRGNRIERVDGKGMLETKTRLLWLGLKRGRHFAHTTCVLGWAAMVCGSTRGYATIPCHCLVFLCPLYGYFLHNAFHSVLVHNLFQLKSLPSLSQVLESIHFPIFCV